MARDRVLVERQVARPPAAVWAVARDFCGLWHPSVAWIRAERDGRGRLLRAFGVAGEDRVYREALTWFSDSDRTLGYRHLHGIAGVEAYDARLSVAPAEGGGSRVIWSAEVAAPAARLRAICDGTAAIFAAGIAALETAALPTVAAAAPAAVPVGERVLDGHPRLALSLTPERGDDRLCLFLHGIGGARGNWRPQLQAAGGVMRAAALDLRGYGESGLGPGQSRVEEYCDDILRVMQALGARRLVLVGLSYGAWIATSFAMRHPGLLDGLVLSGGSTGMSEAGEEERAAFRTAREVPLDAGLVPADFAPAVVKVLAGPEASDAVRAALLQSMAAIPAATYRDALVCFTNPREKFDFSRLSLPVLMMTGQHDRLAPPAEIRAVAQRIHAGAPHPDLRFEVIAGAGHVCNVEAPEVYSRHLVDFLGRLAP